jgi:starch synthase
MNILIASSEAVPFAKTGGLADVAGSLHKEFNKIGHNANIILPFYRRIKQNFIVNDLGLEINVPVGESNFKAKVFSYNNNCYFVKCDELFDRDELYGTPQGDYEDNSIRFIFFSRCILEVCKKLDFKPDIIHCNDWQTGLVPLYLKTIYKNDYFFKDTATVLTIHNIGYQGLFPASDMSKIGIGWEYFNPDGIEFYGKINFLKAGIISADIINTVSKTYAEEILNEESGFGLDGILRTKKDRIFGIINGIDYDEWNPSKDNFLPAKYSYKDIRGKLVCRKDLIKKMFGNNKDSENKPLLGIVGRLSAQKGMDLVIKAAPVMLSSGARLIILGKGDEYIHSELKKMQKNFPEKVSLTLGFDDRLAHNIYAGVDFFLMPSKYEPCGLGQMIAMRYGTVPVARATGGLVDTIDDYDPLIYSGTGFLFHDYSHYAFLNAIKTAFCVYNDSRKMKNLISNTMKKDFSWKNSAEQYIDMYNYAIKIREK